MGDAQSRIFRIIRANNVIIHPQSQVPIWEYDPSEYSIIWLDYLGIEKWRASCVVDHLRDFERVYDGAIDVKGALISSPFHRNVFQDQNKCSLVGAERSDFGDRTRSQRDFPSQLLFQRLATNPALPGFGNSSRL